MWQFEEHGFFLIRVFGVFRGETLKKFHHGTHGKTRKEKEKIRQIFVFFGGGSV
jgi:hypothetical protein